MEDAQTKATRAPREKSSSTSTRLRQQAPAVLQLDEVTDRVNSNNSFHSASKDAAFSRCAIPLLSPLILSPSLVPPLPTREEEQQLAAGNGTDEARSDKNGTAHAASRPQASSGWQHPAVGGHCQSLRLCLLSSNRSALLCTPASSEAAVR